MDSNSVNSVGKFSYREGSINKSYLNEEDDDNELDFPDREKAFSFMSDYDKPIADIKNARNVNGKDTNDSNYEMKPILKSESKKTIVAPSYKTKKQLKSVLIQSTKAEVIHVNDRYNRSRRYDNAGKYRIGPSFITKTRLAYLDENKPAKLSVVPEQSKSLEFGLLTYLSTFTDQHDKQEIDLSFLQSLVDSGVDINYRDEHGQSLLHAVVRDWHSDVAVFAIRNNANVNAQDKTGRTPLHLAAALNCERISRQLLLNKASVDILTKTSKQSPVHFAAKYNSLETLKLLIKFRANFVLSDSQGKTPLFLAAEQGASDTAQFLLDIGAPAGVYDADGISAMSHLLEKMPKVAYKALDQFVICNSSHERREMYLNQLENNKGKTEIIAKSPLEVIAIYDDIDLVMHPVIQKAIEVKWELFGRVDTIRKLLITCVYLICWLVLAYTFTDDRKYYRPWSTNGWKIALEVIIVVFAAYFFYADLAVKSESIRYHRAWIEWRQHSLRSCYAECHSAWPGERQNLESETERIRTVPSLADKQRFWFFYEWVMLLILAGIVATRILDMSLDSKHWFLAHKCVFALGIIVSFVRVLKICIRFRYISVFLKLTGMAVATFIQIGFLYLQLLIPFAAAFWLMFGITNATKSESAKQQHQIVFRHQTAL